MVACSAPCFALLPLGLGHLTERRLAGGCWRAEPNRWPPPRRVHLEVCACACAFCYRCRCGCGREMHLCGCGGGAVQALVSPRCCLKCVAHFCMLASGSAACLVLEAGQLNHRSTAVHVSERRKSRYFDILSPICLACDRAQQVGASRAFAAPTTSFLSHLLRLRPIEAQRLGNWSQTRRRRRKTLRVVPPQPALTQPSERAAKWASAPPARRLAPIIDCYCGHRCHLRLHFANAAARPELEPKRCWNAKARCCFQTKNSPWQFLKPSQAKLAEISRCESQMNWAF